MLTSIRKKTLYLIAILLFTPVIHACDSNTRDQDSSVTASTAIPTLSNTDEPQEPLPIGVIDFVLSSPEDPPDDILGLVPVAYGVIDGGYYCGPSSSELEWIDAMEGAEISFVKAARGPTQRYYLKWCACNVTPESTTVTITSPNGSISSPQINYLNQDPCVSFTYGFEPMPIFGEYIVDLSAQNGQTLRDTFVFPRPERPSGITYLEESFSWFVGFEPNEKVRLLLFAPILEQPNQAPTPRPQIGEMSVITFLAEHEIFANNAGEFIVNFNFDSLPDVIGDGIHIIAVGERSEAGQAINGQYYTIWRILASAEDILGVCDPPSKLSIGGKALLANHDDENPFNTIQIYEEPYQWQFASGLHSILLDDLDQPIEVDVVDGPMCSDGYWWWQISTSDLTGWIRESNFYGYYLEPLP